MAKLPRVQVNVAEQPLFSQHLHQPSQTGLGEPEPGVVDLQQHKGGGTDFIGPTFALFSGRTLP
jgi:hypothetical protein